MCKTALFTSSVQRLLVVMAIFMLATGSAVSARSLKSFLNEIAAEMAELNGISAYDYTEGRMADESSNDNDLPQSGVKVLEPRKFSNQLDQIFEDGQFAGFLRDLKESRAKSHNESPSSTSSQASDADSNVTNNNNKRAKLVKLINTYTPNKNKKGFQITTMYNIVQKEDGSVLLIPKDSNKNHYFIGK